MNIKKKKSSFNQDRPSILFHIILTFYTKQDEIYMSLWLPPQSSLISPYISHENPTRLHNIQQ